MHNTVAADFFTVEVVTPHALVTFYPIGRALRGVLFFIHHATRRVLIAGVTTNPDTPWMVQIARNVTMEGTGFLNGMKYLIHPKARALRGDRDSKFCPAFDHIWYDRSRRVRRAALPAHPCKQAAWVRAGRLPKEADR